MKALLRTIISQYGTAVVVRKDQRDLTVYAFLQPVTSKSWQNMEHLYGSLGQIPRGQYLYIGPVEVDVEKAQYLRLGDKRFLVRRCDTVMIGQRPLYKWALCVEGGYDEDWNKL